MRVMVAMTGVSVRVMVAMTGVSVRVMVASTGVVKTMRRMPIMAIGVGMSHFPRTPVG